MDVVSLGHSVLYRLQLPYLGQARLQNEEKLKKSPPTSSNPRRAHAMLSSIFLLTLAPSLWLTPAVRPTAPTPVARRRAIAPVCQDRWAPESTELSTADKERVLLDWLESNGVYISGMSTWGRPAHPLRVESDTIEDFEPSGRGLLARKQILQVPTKGTMEVQSLRVLVLAISQSQIRILDAWAI